MYGVLAEDLSDAATVRVLIRRIAENPKLRVEVRGFSGCSNLLKKGAASLRLLASQSLQRFVVCHDADGPFSQAMFDHIHATIVAPAAFGNDCCLIMPVQEIEAWLLADSKAINKIFTGWKPKNVPNPETIASPKEHLRRESLFGVAKPRFVPAAHNERIANFIDLAMLYKKCPSYRPLADFVSPKKA